MASSAIALTETVYELGKAVIAAAEAVEYTKFQLKEVESRYMLPIAQDKVKYPNEECRKAAIYLKLASDPYCSQLKAELADKEREYEQLKLEMEKNNNNFRIMVAYLAHES